MSLRGSFRVQKRVIEDLVMKTLIMVVVVGLPVMGGFPVDYGLF